MAQYMLLLYFDEEHYFTNPEERQFSPGYGEWRDAADEAGILRGGEALHPVALATTITVAGGKGGDVLLTDGPFAEAKEVLGGYFVIDVADLDEAVRWATRIPTAWRGKIEIRPVLTLPASTPATAGAARSAGAAAPAATVG